MLLIQSSRSNETDEVATLQWLAGRAMQQAASPLQHGLQCVINSL
jgi:hypothetical protein